MYVKVEQMVDTPWLKQHPVSHLWALCLEQCKLVGRTVTSLVFQEHPPKHNLVEKNMQKQSLVKLGDTNAKSCLEIKPPRKSCFLINNLWVNGGVERHIPQL